MRAKWTDLAVEAAGGELREGGLSRTVVKVEDEASARRLGRPMGTYVTLACEQALTVSLETRRALAAELAYIPQSYHPVFDHTVLESVLMGLSAQLGTFDRPSRAQAVRARQILSELGIAQLAERGCTRISGGERQLMLLGRALMQNAHTLVMDEPTASLDYGNSFRVMQRIESLSAGGYSVIFSTHEPNQAFRYATKVLALKDGRVLAFGPPADVLTPELLEALYGVRVAVTQVLAGGRSFSVCTPYAEEGR